LTFLSVLLLLTLIAGIVVDLCGYKVFKIIVQSDLGQNMASIAISKAIKVDGTFAPLKLDGWTLTTDSFTSAGWPGEAIGGLNTYGVKAELDPAAVWRGVWRIKGIQLDHSDISLLTPNDALKRPTPPKKPKPWYAHFLPSVFECGPIISPVTQLDFEFEKQIAHIRNAQVEADLIGRDFQYTATSGTMEFPYLPPLQIKLLKMLVTRPVVTINDAELVGLAPNDTARMSLHGNIGMRDNKEIEAIVEITEMPIEQMLPENIAPLIHGRATGHLVWKRDKTGQDILSEGEVSLSGARIDDLSVFKQLALLHGNPDLQDFAFDTFTLKFQMRNGEFTADIVAIAPGKFSLTGTITYNQKTKQAGIDVEVKELPLKTWLPSDFKPRYAGVATASLHWRGQLDRVKDSSGTLSIDLDGTHITDPVLLKQFLATKGLRAPDELNFKTAQLDFTYQDETFQLARAELDVPGVMTARATATLTTPDDSLDGDVSWQNLTLANWLPQKIADQISGDLNGSVKFHVQQWKYKDGSYAGAIELTSGQLSYTSVQSTFARFVNDRRLLTIPVTRARCVYSWVNGTLAITEVDLRAGDDIGITGNLTLSQSGTVSGTLWVGTKPVYLKSLMGLADGVFTRNEAGLRWAKVTISGTSKEPKQDLSKQLMAQLGNHPLTVFGLGGKMASWYVGDIFGADDDWKKPEKK
jgi:hypothetical protein